MRFDATIPMFALCMASCVLRTPSFTPSLGAAVSSAPSVPAPGDEASNDSGVIEAGCTFSGSDIKGEPGSVHPLVCPAGCAKDVTVRGTDVYTAGSPICAAAMHASMISDRGGEVTVVLEPGRPAYRGSKHNGITSQDWGKYDASFRFQGPRIVQTEPQAVRAPIVVDAGCTFEGNDVHGEPGSLHRVSCPAGCKTDEPRVYGTDTYAGLSKVCNSAIHAGLITNEQGGEFTLILGDARPAFRGSKRNGIESRDWTRDGVSFRLQR
jgi:hypothetical protein